MRSLSDNGLKRHHFRLKIPQEWSLHPQIPRKQLKGLAKQISLGYCFSYDRLESGVEIPIHYPLIIAEKTRTVKYFLSLLLATALFQTSSAVAAEPSKTLSDLLGVWSGRFTRITPEGASSGVTYYEFTEQTGNLLRGENRWKVQEGPEDHASEQPSQGTNSFLGVISGDGTIYLVADGDTAIRRLRLTSSNTIDFVEFAGGEHPIVVSVKLLREGSKAVGGSVSGASGKNN